MKKTTQSGFAAIEAILILIIVAIIGGTGYFVWHAKQNTDKSLDAANNSKQSVSTKKSSTNNDQSTVHQQSDGNGLTGAGATELVKDTYETYLTATADKSREQALATIKTKLSDDVYNKLLNASEYDALLCAQSTPSKLNFVLTSSSNDSAAVNVEETFGDSINKVLTTVNLHTSVIDSITCTNR